MRHHRSGRAGVGCALLLGAASFIHAPVAAQSTVRASVDSGGGQADGGSRSVLISADGKCVVFLSDATNLVPQDTNGSTDVFLRELATGLTTRISVSSSNAQGDRSSSRPSISSDGRFVAFTSDATNLVAGDANGVSDIFVRDRLTSTTTRVSVSSNGTEADAGSYRPSISSDGRYVAFASDATNLVSGDTNGCRDVFVHDRQSGATSRVSLTSSGAESDGASSGPSITSDGRYVAFSSFADDLVIGDSNGAWDAFVHDRSTGVTARVSVGPGGAQGNADSYAFSISADGRHVAFWSFASSLVPLDTNGVADAFVHDRQNGVTTRVSVDSSGAQADGACSDPSISSDGRFVAFFGSATNLVPGDTNACEDAFVRDMQAGTTVRISLDSNGAEGDMKSIEPSISADGRFVAFWGEADDLVPGDTNALPDVFVRDRGIASAYTSFCFGDGSGGACPCGNDGGVGRGCDNSTANGGAELLGAGVASVAGDTLHLTTSGELPSALSIVLQGDVAIAPVSFGDGLRCAGGSLKRLYVANASSGAIVLPGPSDVSISARSAALGDPIPLGATRDYQVYYRDPSTAFCPAPLGGTFNVSNALAVAWGS